MPRHIRWSLFAGLVAFYMLFRPSSLLSVDEELLYRTTVALAERGSLEIVPLDRPAEADVKPGERTTAKYGVLPSLAAVPFYWLGKVLAAFAPEALADDVRRAVTGSASAVWMALAVVEFVVLIELLGFSCGVPLAMALVLGLTTPVFVYSRSFHIVAMSTLLLTALVRRAAWYELSPARNRALVLGGLLGLLLLSSFQFVLLLPVVVWFVWSAGGRCRGDGPPTSSPQATHNPSPPGRAAAVGCFLVTTLLGVILVMAVNFLRTDESTWNTWRQNDGVLALAVHLLRGGYAGEHFVTPLRVGLYGLLVSPSRGLLWYSPVSLLGVVYLGHFWRARRDLAWLVAAIVVVVVLSSSKWWAWNGGLNWGPRYLVGIVPLTLVPFAYCARRWEEVSGPRRGLIVALILASGIVQFRGATTDYHQAMEPIASLSRGENERWFVPQLSPLWWNVHSETGLLWVRWYESGHGGLVLLTVAVWAVAAVGGLSATFRTLGGVRVLRRVLAWPTWGTLAALGLAWGAYDVWLVAGHGLRAHVPSASASEVQFSRSRWRWEAPAAGYAEWTGYLRVPQNGDFYSLFLAGDGTAELEIAETVRLKHAGGSRRWSVWNGRLDVGVYRLKLRSYPSSAKAEHVGLAWSLHGSSLDRQPIGPEFLYPDPPGKARLFVDRMMEWSWFWALLAGLFLLAPRGPELPKSG